MRLEVLCYPSYNNRMSDRPESRKSLKEKRRAPRVATSNFVGFVCLDEDGEGISEGYGWTVNLSQSGIRIETFRRIETRRVMLLAINIEDELLEVKGEVVYAQAPEHHRYQFGIRFLEEEREQRRMISSFVKSYYHRDKALAERIDYEKLFKEKE